MGSQLPRYGFIRNQIGAEFQNGIGHEAASMGDGILEIILLRLEKLDQAALLRHFEGRD